MVGDSFDTIVILSFLYYIMCRSFGSIKSAMDTFHKSVTGSKQIRSTLRPKQNGRHFADDIFERSFLNVNCCIFIETSLKFVQEIQL